MHVLTKENLDSKKIGTVFEALTEVLESRKQSDPNSSYVSSLFEKGLDAILKKIGEEATEVVIAAKDNNHSDLVYEMADLWFHSLVLLANEGLSAQNVLVELERRFGLSGIDEKNARLNKLDQRK